MKLVTAVCVGLLLAHSSNAALSWGSGTNVIQNFDGDPVPTSAFFPSTPDSTTGAFAQLIRILTGSTPSAFTPSGSGIDISNEEVVHTTYSGQGNFANAGTFEFRTANALNSSDFNGFYYVRVFDAPQNSDVNFQLGNDAPIPSTAQYYFQSDTYEYTYAVDPATWNFGGGQTTLAVVPEPSVIAIMGLGLFGLASARRRLQA